MKIDLIRYSKYWFALSGVLIALSIAAVAAFGLKPSIQFTGGSILEFSTNQPHEVSDINDAFADAGITVVVQPSGEDNFIARMPELDTKSKEELISKLNASLEGGVQEERFESIGPVLGQELVRKSTIAVILLLLSIVGYVAWTFRTVSKPVSSWKYGTVTIVAALHDVIIPMGVFAILGKTAGYEIDVAFIAAMLTILGYSINDTIVILDRIRENVLRKRHVSDDEFADVVNASINQSAVRSVHTSVTTLLALVAVFFFGGDTLQPFALALIIGILTGTYSSIFIASPLLTLWHKQSKK